MAKYTEIWQSGYDAGMFNPSTTFNKEEASEWIEGYETGLRHKTCPHCNSTNTRPQPPVMEYYSRICRDCNKTYKLT